MSGTDFLRLAKLKGGGKVSLAARHNRREIQAEMGASGHIDPTRTHLNETLAGPPTASDVAALARSLMREAGIAKPRKDAVLAVEVIFSLPTVHTVDESRYFSECLEWTAQRFGGNANILSADIHRDESAPHCHVLILPLINGRLVGSDMVGNRSKLRDHRQSLYIAVGARHGLTKAPARLSGPTKPAAVAQVLECLQSGPDAAMQSRVWPQIRASIEHEPGPYLSALGLGAKPRAKRMRTMTQIFTSPGRGPAREKRNPIGFGAPFEPRTLSCVGFAAPTPPTTTPALPEREEHTRTAPDPVPPIHQGTERLREDELDASLFDPVTGEFRQPVQGRQSNTHDLWFGLDD